MPVIAAVELDHQVAAGRGPGQPQGAHGRLRPAVDESQALDRRHAFTNQLAQANLGGTGCSERASGVYRPPDRLDYSRMRVSKDEGPESSDVIDVPVAVDIPDERALAAAHDRWVAADRAISPDRAVHSPRKQLVRPLTPRCGGI